MKREMTFYMLRNRDTKEFYRRSGNSSPAVWSSLDGVASARGAITKKWYRRNREGHPTPEFETVTITADIPE
jgi:hypothetical protein